jgi:hypothetical protein
MRKWLLIIIGTATLAAGALSQNQAPQATDTGWGPNDPYNRLYNRETEVTFTGTVTGVANTALFSQNMSPGITLFVRATNGGMAVVDLGPRWFVEQQRPAIQPGDRVTVTGSKVFVDNESRILTRTLVRNNQVMYLRETSGFPMWVATRGHINVQGAGEIGRTSPLPGTTADPAGPGRELQEVQGRLVRTEQWTDAQTGEVSLHLVLETEQGLIRVDAGPQWFWQRQEVTWPMNGNVRLHTQPVPVDSPTPIYIAHDMYWDNNVVIFRNANGRPIWSTWGGF